MNSITVIMDFFTVLFLLLISNIATAAKVPKNWRICKPNNPDRLCLQAAIEEAIFSLRNGMPSLGVLPLEPLHFERMNVNQGEGPVAVNLTFINFDLIGFSSVKVTNVNFDRTKMIIKLRLNTTEPLILKGDYTTSGKIIILPIQGKGKCTLTFENFSSFVILRGNLIEKNKVKYYNLDHFDLDISTSKLIMRFEGLFHGDKAMGENMNKFLNENWRDILNELKPAISKAFGAGLKEISNRVFSRIPAKDLALA